METKQENKKKIISKSSIDWISITFPSGTKPEAMLPPEMDFRYEEIKSPIPVYNQAFEVRPIKAKLMFGAERLGNHLIMSGKAMKELREYEVSLPELWQHWQTSRGRLSRIDLAVDVFENENFSPKVIELLYMYGWCETKIKRNKTISENMQAETFYIGSMTSKNAKFRAYNKGLEQGITEYSWCRIEYEKRKNAQQWGKALFEQNKSIKSMIRSSVDFPNWKIWNDVMGSEIESVPRNEEKPPTDFETRLAWIINSVLPAMAKTIVDDPTFNRDKFNVEDTYSVKTINSVLWALIEKEIFKQNLDMSRYE